MPWILRTYLTIAPGLFLAYIYLSWKLYGAITHFSTWPKNHIRWYLVAAVTFFNLNPLLLLLLHAFGLDNISKSIRAGNRIWDLFFTYPFWIGLIIVVEVTPWLLAMDFVKLPLYPFYQKFKTTWLRYQNLTIVLLFICLSAYVLLKVFVDTTMIHISTTTHVIAGLPERLSGMRIVHISDVQMDNRTGKRKLKRYVKKINKLKPDLVFITGDIVTSGTRYVARAAELLGGIESRYGTYACVGDHDIWADGRLVVKQLNGNGITTIEDANRMIPVGRDTVLATFLTNTYPRRPDHETIFYLMGQQPRGVIDLVVVHQPSESLVELAAERGYHLFLGGHTHGGQVVLKPLGITFTPAKFETIYFQGIYDVKQMLISINSGLGFTFAPIRFRAPAEITLISVSSKSD